jgi:hypothetical protein
VQVNLLLAHLLHLGQLVQCEHFSWRLAGRAAVDELVEPVNLLGHMRLDGHPVAHRDTTRAPLSRTRNLRARVEGLVLGVLRDSPMYPTYSAAEDAAGSPLFKPIERGSQMFIQLFDESGQVGPAACVLSVPAAPADRVQGWHFFCFFCLSLPPRVCCVRLRRSVVLTRLFSQAYHKPVWLEINGHAVNVFNGQRDPAPAIRFDLRETRIMAAVRGLPRPTIDTTAPVLAIVSRYFVDEKTGDCCFFFQTQNENDKQEWSTNECVWGELYF